MNKLSIKLPITETIPAKPGDVLNIIVRSQGTLEVVFAIDPESAESQDDKFILYSTDDENTYYQEKTIKEDVTAGDDVTEIVFSALNRDLCYSLQVDPGDKRKPYFVFENRTYADLSKKCV